MVPACCVKDSLDSVVHVQKRRVLPSESSQTHHGRRGKTFITFRLSQAILKMTFSYASESEFYDAILQREHHFITVSHAELLWPMKYTKMHQIINIASLFP